MVTGSFTVQSGEISCVCSVDKGYPEQFVILTDPEHYQAQDHRNLKDRHVIVLDPVTNVAVLKLTCKTLTILSDLGAANGAVFVEGAQFVVNFTEKQVISSEPCIQRIEADSKVLSAIRKAVRAAVSAQDVSLMVDALAKVILVRDQGEVASGLQPLSDAPREFAFKAFFNLS